MASLANFSRCPRCEDKFDNEKRFPYMLQCGHNYCIDCVNEMQTYGIGVDLKCANCLVVSENIPENRNHALLEALQYIEEEKEQRKRRDENEKKKKKECGECGELEKIDRLSICVTCTTGLFEEKTEEEIQSSILCAFCLSHHDYLHSAVQYLPWKASNYLKNIVEEGPNETSAIEITREDIGEQCDEWKKAKLRATKFNTDHVTSEKAFEAINKIGQIVRREKEIVREYGEKTLASMKNYATAVMDSASILNDALDEAESAGAPLKKKARYEWTDINIET